VVASRKIPGGGTPDWSFYRKTVSSAANLLARSLLGLGVKDATSGYRAFTRRAVEAIDFPSIGESGFAFQIETLSRARKAGLKVMEVPFIYRERIHGKSKFGRKEVWAFIRTVFRLAFD
jgi:dolichol-phosphate mannosyltransferase